MIVLSRDGDWLLRLEQLAARNGWPFEARAALPSVVGYRPPEHTLAVLDRALSGAVIGKAVDLLRALYPSAAIVLAFDEGDMSHEAVAAAVTCGADEVLGKSWPEAKLASRLAALRDRALAAQALVSTDGALKAQRRAHRAFIKTRGKWKEVKLDAGGFALLWILMRHEGESVSRDELSAALTEAAGREHEAGTVSRRLAALRKALAPWKGEIEAARGGFYRMQSTAKRVR